MNGDGQYYNTSTGRLDEIDDLVDIAVESAKTPAAEFAERMSAILQQREAETPFKLEIDTQRIAKEVSRAIVLDVVQRGIRAIPESTRLRSDIMLEIYEQACVLCDRAVETHFSEDNTEFEARDVGT